MNYPTVIQNPLLKFTQPKPDFGAKTFSNQERPYSCPAQKLVRPFTGRVPINIKLTEQKDSAHQSLQITHSQLESNEAEPVPEQLPRMSLSAADLKFGKSINQSNFDIMSHGAIGTLDRIFSALPAPKAKKGKKKKKAAEAAEEEPAPEGGKAKKKKKKKAKKSTLPEVPPTLYGPPQTVDQAMGNTISWSQNNNINTKQAAGVLTTVSHSTRAATFDQMNPIGHRSAIEPQTQFVGSKPDNQHFVRRVVRQLNDIEFSDEEEPEELHNLRRLPPTVLTEETLKEYLNAGTGKVNFENYYWISNAFLSKLGRLTPNLQALSLRRMPQITNKVFADMFEFFGHLRTVDLCDCEGLQQTALQLMLRRNPQLEQIQLSGCVNAVDDKAMRLISNQPGLEFLDISYCSQVTDNGLVHFADKTLPLTAVYINGLS